MCVFCGSLPGTDPLFSDSARALGRGLADAGWELIFGGSSIGLMGCVADAVMESGGRATGVRPRRMFLEEPPHSGLTAMHEVDSMHERKKLMSDLADAFVALPGGLGTLDELAEVLSWAQMGLHRKPVVVIDLMGYWSPFFDQLARAEDDGFLRPGDRRIVTRVRTAAEALDVLTAELRTTGTRGAA